MEPNMIGAYGPWAAGLVGEGPARLSFRHGPRSRRATSTPGGSEARDRLKRVPAPARDRGRPPGRGPAPARLRRPARRAPALAAPLRPADRGRLPQAGRRHRDGCRRCWACTTTAATSTSAARKIAQIERRAPPDDEGAPRRLLRRRELGQRAGQARATPCSSTTPSPFASRRVRVGDVPPVLRKDLKEVNPESSRGDQGLQQVRRRARAHHGQEPLLRRDDLAGRLHGRGPARPRLPLLARPTSTPTASAAPGSPAAACAPSTSPASTTGSAAPAASA